MVRDKKVQIIDEFTGRAMPDRKWSQGIHEMIELREQCVVTSAMVTVARMTYQRFFRRYMRLAGMSGTCVEVARELWRVYRLAVARIPPHRTRRLVIGRSRVLATQDRKWRLVVKSVVALHQQGSPVLLGTRTVSASEIAAAHLAKAGVPFVLLNAEQDANEADIVAQAGQRGRVTIATNMSGRGTDISIGEDTLVLGGLHVIMSERHESRRIDRQLAGRAGRQGRPGHFQEIVSLDDPLMVNMDRMGILRIIGRILVPVAGRVGGARCIAVCPKTVRNVCTLECETISLCRTNIWGLRWRSAENRNRGMLRFLMMSLVLVVEVAYGAESTFDCVLEPAQLVRVGSSTAGIIDEVMVERGDFVERGQVLARLKSSVQEAIVEIFRVQATSTATIKAHESRVSFSRKRLERAKVLWEKKLMPSDTYDQLVSELILAENELARGLVGASNHATRT